MAKQSPLPTLKRGWSVVAAPMINDGDETWVLPLSARISSKKSNLPTLSLGLPIQIILGMDQTTVGGCWFIPVRRNEWRRQITSPSIIATDKKKPSYFDERRKGTAILPHICWLDKWCLFSCMWEVLFVAENKHTWGYWCWGFIYRQVFFYLARTWRPLSECLCPAYTQGCEIYVVMRWFARAYDRHLLLLLLSTWNLRAWELWGREGRQDIARPGMEFDNYIKAIFPSLPPFQSTKDGRNSLFCFCLVNPVPGWTPFQDWRDAHNLAWDRGEDRKTHLHSLPFLPFCLSLLDVKHGVETEKKKEWDYSPTITSCKTIIAIKLSPTLPWSNASNSYESVSANSTPFFPPSLHIYS